MKLDGGIRPRKPRQTTPWRAVTWERSYRGECIYIEEMFQRAPKWEWTVAGGEYSGRARTKVAAMRAAEKAVNASLKEGEDHGG